MATDLVTQAEARQKVLEAVNPALRAFDDEAMVLDAHTLVRPYGWIFHYQSRKFLETGIVSYALAGNGPVVVLRRDGSVHRLGTARGLDETIASFEKLMNLA